jgi:hypothetical protein
MKVSCEKRVRSVTLKIQTVHIVGRPSQRPVDMLKDFEYRLSTNSAGVILMNKVRLLKLGI